MNQDPTIPPTDSPASDAATPEVTSATAPATDAPDAAPAGERIAKALSRAGVASRRDVERMILDGRVSVNGKTITSPATNVTARDRLAVDGQPVAAAEPPRLWLYHKPAGLVTTTKDELGRDTVFDHLPEGMPRVMTVGRLDLTSEGLLLLTNDGEVKRKLELPTTGWLRRYRVRVNGEVTEPDLDKLRAGITIDDVVYQPMDVTLDRQQGANAWLTVGLREGKNREIRRVMEEIGFVVNRLIRISYGPFQLGALEAGDVQEVRRKILRDQLGLDNDEPDLQRGRRVQRNGQKVEDDAPKRGRPAKPGFGKPAFAKSGFAKSGDKPFGARPQREDDGFARKPRSFGAGRDDRPFGDKPRGERPYGDRPRSDAPRDARPTGERPRYDKPRFDKPRYEKGDAEGRGRPQGDKPRFDKPRFDKPRGERPQGERPYGDRPRGDKPYAGKPRDERPRGDNPRGERPFAARSRDDRPRDDRPRDDRPREDRPRFDKPRGPRPQGDAPRGGDRPFSGKPREDRPRSDKPRFDKPRDGAGRDGGKGEFKPRTFTPRSEGDKPRGPRPARDGQNGPRGPRPEGRSGPRPDGNRRPPKPRS